VRARVGITVACFSAFAFAIFTGSFLYAQTTPQAAGASTQNSTNDLVVAVGKSLLVDCAHPIQRVAIGLGDFAQAQAVTPTEILLNGKTAGETSLIIWEVGGERQFFNVSVLPASALSNDQLEGLRRELRTELPGQIVKISTESGNIFLRGTVKDLGSSQRAVDIASTAGKVVNLLDVIVPPSDPAQGTVCQRRPESRKTIRHQLLQHRLGKHDRRNQHRRIQPTIDLASKRWNPRHSNPVE
jgi:pilus assembly protein CpaC